MHKDYGVCLNLWGFPIAYTVKCSFFRIFRIMDDDGSKNLDYAEFKKGIRDYGVSLEEDVSFNDFFAACLLTS